MKRAFLLIFVLLGFLQTVQGQAALGLGSPAVTFNQDTFDYGAGDSLLVMNVTVKNKGNAPLIGNFQIMGLFNEDSVPVLLKGVKIEYMAPGDSITYPIEDQLRIRGTRYGGGDNVIVIWPKSDVPGVQSVDTTHQVIVVENFHDQKQPEGNPNRAQVFPNPTAENLNVRIINGNEIFECVRVISPLGQIVLEEYGMNVPVNCALLANGVYLVEVRFRDGHNSLFRVHVAH